jgi:hypothetical protein
LTWICRNYTLKKENGRYERWREPEPHFDNALYRKYVYGKKVYYNPVSMLIEKELDEGVWVITKHLYGKNYSTGHYLRDCFMCQKASDIQETPLSKLGGMDKLADWLSNNWDKLPKKTSQYDFCRAIVGILMEYEKEKNGK